MKLFQLRYWTVFLVILLTLVFVADGRKVCSAAEGKSASAAWTEAKTYRLRGLEVSLSKPILVGRSKDFFWFPQIARLSDGELMAIVKTSTDWNPCTHTAAITWSADGGLTWSTPKPYVPETASEIDMPSGDLLLLPYLLHPRSDGVMGAPYHLIPKGKREVDLVDTGVSFSGFPYLPMPGDAEHTSLAVYGRCVRLRNGKYLVPLYGWYKDFPNQSLKESNEDELALGTTPQGQYKPKRTGLFAAESWDGIHWERGATIADQNCPLKGEEGASESAICRLKDGRLMCLFRMDSGLPYGETWSSDDGKTWTTPAAASGPFSVAPNAVVTKDGTIVLAGGRPGLFLWFNTDGRGTDWQRIDPREAHNASLPNNAITDGSGRNTTSYSQLVALDDTHLLYIYDHTRYDRVAHGWDKNPKDISGYNSIWVMRVTLKQVSR